MGRDKEISDHWNTYQSAYNNGEHVPVMALPQAVSSANAYLQATAHLSLEERRKQAAERNAARLAELARARGANAS